MQITLEVCNTLAVTAFRDEWQEKKADWMDLVAGPAKLVIDTLAEEQPAHPTRKCCLFSDMAQGQSHIGGATLGQKWLHLSPFYIEIKPNKDQDLQLQQDFWIMWIRKDTPASDVISKISEHHGLVRGRTGQGIRLEDVQFKKAHALFYPNRPLPEKIISNYKWILLGVVSKNPMKQAQPAPRPRGRPPGSKNTRAAPVEEQKNAQSQRMKSTPPSSPRG